MNKILISFTCVFVFNINAFAYCPYRDCTSDVISEAISFVNDLQEPFQDINDKVDEIDDVYKKWADKVEEQEKKINKVETMAYEYYVLLKEIRKVKEKTLFYKTKYTKE
jgi:peptidoglycan hydrolase CwlO-like protein